MHCSCVSTVYLIIVKHFWHCLVICTKFHSLVWFQEERLLNTYMLITRSTVTLKDVLLGLELTDLSFSPWVILVFLLTVFLKNFCTLKSALYCIIEMLNCFACKLYVKYYSHISIDTHTMTWMDSRCLLYKISI